MKISKTLAQLLVTLLIFNTTYATDVQTDVNNIKASSDVWTFWKIIQAIFNNTWEITWEYLELDQVITSDISEQNSVPSSKAVQDLFDSGVGLWTENWSDIYYDWLNNLWGVGIWTDNPIAKFHVVNSSADEFYINSQLVKNVNTTSWWARHLEFQSNWWKRANFWAYWSNNDLNYLYLDARGAVSPFLNSQFVLKPTGNVWIGETNPGSKLEVKWDSWVVAEFTQNSVSWVDAWIKVVGARNNTAWWDTAYIDLSNYDSNEWWWTEYVMWRIWAWMDDVTGQTGLLKFSTNSWNNLSEKMRIDKDGNVWIWTISPNYKLDVAWDVNFTGDLRYNGVAVDFAWKFEDWATLWEIYYTDGNVWIGNTDPSQNLHVTWNSLVTWRTYIGSSDSYFYRDAANRIATPDNFHVQSSSASTYLYSANTYLWAVSWDTTQLRWNNFTWNEWVIQWNGNVWIWTTNPSVKLHVWWVTRSDDWFSVDGTTVIWADAWVEWVRIREWTIDWTKIEDESLTALDLDANSVWNSELVDDITVDYVRWINALEWDRWNIATSTDEWLRLNNGWTHTSGTYTQWLFRTDWGVNVDNITVIDWNGWVKWDRIEQNSIDASELATNSVWALELWPNSVDSGNVKANSLTADDLDEDSVWISELADDSVASDNIIDNTITEDDISDSFVARNSDLLDGKDSLDFETKQRATAKTVNAWWYTIAKIASWRASAKFSIRETRSSSHQAVHFYAQHHYWTWNAITVLADSSYGSGGAFRFLRIKDFWVYNWAVLQVYVDVNSTPVYAEITDNIQINWWTVVDWAPDGTITSPDESILAETASLDLDMGSSIQTTDLVNTLWGYKVDWTVVVDWNAWVIWDRISQDSIDNSEIEDNSLTALSLAPSSVASSELAPILTYTDSAWNASVRSLTIDNNVSWSDILSTDRSHSAFRIDLDSTATGWDTANEHRVFGIESDVDVTGDSDLVYGWYLTANSTHSSGIITNIKWTYWVASSNGTGKVTSLFWWDFLATDSSNGETTYVHWSNWKALKDAWSTNTTNSMMGARWEVEIDAGTLTNAYATKSVIDRDWWTITNWYLFHWDYTGTFPTNAYGLHITDPVKNYLGWALTLLWDPISWNDVWNRDYNDARYVNEDDIDSQTLSWDVSWPINNTVIWIDTIDSTNVKINSLTADDLGTDSVWNEELIDNPTFDTLEFSKNNINHYTNLAHFSQNSNVTWVMKITMPKSWSNTMGVTTIKWYNYNAIWSWEVIVSWYNHLPSTSWSNTAAEIRWTAPFNKVRLAHDGTNNIIILWDTSTLWRNPKIVVSDFVAWFSGRSDWDLNWTIWIQNNETGFASISEPVIRTYLASDGSFGIWTTTPDANLEVVWDRIRLVDTNNAHLQIASSASNMWTWRAETDGDFSLQKWWYDGSAYGIWSTNVLTIKDNEYFGIWTSAPTEELSVAGGLSITDNPDSGDDVWDRDYNDARYVNIADSWTQVLSWDVVWPLNNNTIWLNVVDDTHIVDDFKSPDSDKLDWYNSAQNSTPLTAAIRDTNGDIKARLFRSEFDSTNWSVNYIMTQIDTANNNYIRPSTPAQFRASVTDDEYINETETFWWDVSWTYKSLSLENNSVWNAELIANPTFTNPIVATPTANTHAANKKYVDDLINGLTWKEPSVTTAAGTHWTCTSAKESWTTFNKWDSIIYVCNGSAWVEMSSTIGIPDLDWEVTGALLSTEVSDDVIDTNNIIDETILSRDIDNETITYFDIKDGTIRSEEIENGDVQNIDLANSSVNSIKVEDNTLTASDLAENSVASSELAGTLVYTDNVANSNTRSLIIDHNASWSDVLTADRTHSSLRIDLDSSATGWDTANEHRVYWVETDIDVSGDSDLVYGWVFDTKTNHTAGTISAQRGTYSLAISDWTAKVTTLHWAYNNAIDSSAWENTNVIWTTWRANKDGGSTDTTNTMIGTESEVEINAWAINNAYASKALIDRNAWTITNGYLFHWDYLGTLPTNAYGVYIPDAVDNYFAWNVWIWTNSPQAELDVNWTLRVWASADNTYNLTPSYGWLLLKSASNYSRSSAVYQWEANWVDGWLQLVSTHYWIEFKTWVNPNTKMIIEGAWNVWIWNTNPSQKLDVVWNGLFSWTVTAATPTADTHLTTKAYVDSAIWWAWDNLWNHTATQSLSLGAFDIVGNGRLHIDTWVTTGVYDDATSDAPYARITAPSLHTEGMGVGQLFLEGHAIDSNLAINIGVGLAWWQAVQDIKLWNDNELYVDTSTNNVGIWTATPSTKLDVEWDITVGSALTIYNNNAVASSPDIEMLWSWLLAAEDDFHFMMDSDNNNTNRSFYFSKNDRDTSNDSILMEIQEDGNVWIGTTAPSEKLSVNGWISITDNPDSDDDVWDRGYNDLRYLKVSDWITLAWDVSGPNSNTVIENDTIDSANVKINSLTSADLWTDSAWNDEMVDNAQFETLEFTRDSVSHYKNVAQFSSTSTTWVMKITMAKSWSNTMWVTTIKWYDYSWTWPWEVVVSWYNHAGSTNWSRATAEIRWKAPFTKVRLGHDGTKNIILLWETTTSWIHPKAVVTDFIAWFNGRSDWEKDWTIWIQTNETGFTNIAQPAINTYLTSAWNFGIWTTTPTQKLDVAWNGLFSWTLTAATPTADAHLTTKAYVDSAIGSSEWDNLWNHIATQNLSLWAFGIVWNGSLNIETWLTTGVYDDAASDAPYSRVSASSLHTQGIWVWQLFLEWPAIDGNLPINIGSGLAWGQAAQDIKLWNDNELYVDTSTNNVGIWTATPATKLAVAWNSLVTWNTYIGSTDSYFYRDAANRIATPDNFYVQASSAATYLYSANTYLWATSWDVTDLRWNTFQWNQWIIEWNGNVGIWTTTPSTELEVDGTILSKNLTLQNSTQYPLYLNNTSNAWRVWIQFSDQNAELQKWHIEFVHSDWDSYWAGASFHVWSTESKTNLIVDWDVVALSRLSVSDNPDSGDDVWDRDYNDGRYLSSSTISVSGDWNDHIDTWFYRWQSLTNQCPGSSWRYVTVMYHNDLWVSQTCNDFSWTWVYQRNKMNWTWWAWRMLIESDDSFGWDVSWPYNNLQLGLNSVWNNELIANPTFTNPIVSTPTANTHAANKAYVDSQSTWIQNGTDIYYNGGSVWIWTSTPTARLHIAAPSGDSSTIFTGGGIEIARNESDWSDFWGFIDLKTSPADDAKVRLSYNENLHWTLWGFIISTDIDGGIYENATPRFTVLETGNIWVWTLTPWEKLEVNGNVKATAFLYSSDERLKKNIRYLQSSRNNRKSRMSEFWMED